MAYLGINANYRNSSKAASGSGGGGGSGNIANSFIATGSVSAHRIIAVDTTLDLIVYAEVSNPLHCHNILGLTINAALAGDPVIYVPNGLVKNLAGLVPGRVWLGASGSLVQVPPTVGNLVPLGTIHPDGTSFQVNIGFPIIRS